jgi:DmsE family decaheme c-type cytochrome
MVYRSYASGKAVTMTRRVQGFPDMRRHNKRALPWALTLLTSVLLVSGVSAQQSGKRADPAITAQFTGDGIDTCLLCHDVERMRLIADTPHGKKDDPHTPWSQHGCESCHGPGSLHATRSRRGKGRPPMIDYGYNKERVTTPATVQTETCLDGCHAQDMGKLKGMEWAGSTHAIALMEVKGGGKKRMSCSACHLVHITQDPLSDKEEQAQTCYTCHEKMKSEHPNLEDKGINIDKVSCWTCHDVHQLIPETEQQAGN